MCHVVCMSDVYVWLCVCSCNMQVSAWIQRQHLQSCSGADLVWDWWYFDENFLVLPSTWMWVHTYIHTTTRKHTQMQSLMINHSICFLPVSIFVFNFCFALTTSEGTKDMATESRIKEKKKCISHVQNLGWTWTGKVSSHMFSMWLGFFFQKCQSQWLR